MSIAPFSQHRPVNPAPQEQSVALFVPPFWQFGWQPCSSEAWPGQETPPQWPGSDIDLVLVLFPLVPQGMLHADQADHWVQQDARHVRIRSWARWCSALRSLDSDSSSCSSPQTLLMPHRRTRNNDLATLGTKNTSLPGSPFKWSSLTSARSFLWMGSALNKWSLWVIRESMLDLFVMIKTPA